MTQIYLMDLHGHPRLVLNQPSPVGNDRERSAWLSVFTAVSSLPEGKELKVKFSTGCGRMATAYIVNHDNRMDILPGGDVNLFMYARDIIPEEGYINI